MTLRMSNLTARTYEHMVPYSRSVRSTYVYALCLRCQVSVFTAQVQEKNSGQIMLKFYYHLAYHY